jgi:TatD DNase family protein
VIDTHCHLTYEGLFEQVDAVVARAAGAGVDRMISVGTSPDDARAALGLTRRFGGVYSTVGVHPHYAHQWTDRDAVADAMRELAGQAKVVALGEMGLDRHYPDPPIEDQRRVFGWQLEVAGGLEGGSAKPQAATDRSAKPQAALPLIIHNREATDEVVAMIRDSGLPGDRFVFHCFTGDDRELDAILDLGAMVSFTGIVTFKNARALASSSARVPDDRIMVETDSPYLTPEPHRKVRPNEPCYVPHVARFLASQRGVEVDAFVRQADANAQRFFNLP